MRKIKIGVYDNNGGHQITKEILANPDICGEIVASCRCQQAESIENVTVYDSLEEMMADERIELISLCSPNRRKQAQEAIRCMRAGKHVLAEKPCAMTEEELDEIIRVSKETGKTFHEMAGSVFMQPFWAMRELVMSGALGETVQVYTQKSYPLKINNRPQDEDVDGGLLLQVGVHNMRFIEHITGIRIRKIHAIQTKKGNPCETGDLHTAASYMMELENGGIASAVANYLNRPKGFGKYGNECVRVFGTKGYAEIMDGGRKNRVIIGDEEPRELDLSKKPKSFLACYLESLLGISEMPIDLDTELHPTRMVIRAREQSQSIQRELNRLSDCGGRVNLPCGQYDVATPLVIDTSSLCLSGDVWSCNTDPNGVFETDHGTKLRMRGREFPALKIGKDCDPISGSQVRDLGIQGDIPGMDTRPLMDFKNPSAASGLCLDRVRTDQCEFAKLSFCGLSSAVCVTGNAEVDACRFEKLNTDGCGNGFYFAPRASYYARVYSCIMADNPYYGFYAEGKGRNIHNLEIFDCHFVRNAGCFRDGDNRIPAALLFEHVSRCAVSHCLFDAPGTFWYYEDDATLNKERQPSYRKAVAMYIIGDENRLKDNTFLNSSDDSIRIEGNGNILLSNIVDGNVRICGEGNVVSGLIFTKPEARLILEGRAKETTRLIGVEEDRIVML